METKLQMRNAHMTRQEKRDHEMQTVFEATQMILEAVCSNCNGNDMDIDNIRNANAPNINTILITMNDGTDIEVKVRITNSRRS